MCVTIGLPLWSSACSLVYGAQLSLAKFIAQYTWPAIEVIHNRYARMHVCDCSLIYLQTM